jgi:hypothetical protein
MKICKNCDTYVNGICSKDKGGCGCIISAKVKCVNCKCPKNKWPTV